MISLEIKCSTESIILITEYIKKEYGESCLVGYCDLSENSLENIFITYANIENDIIYVDFDYLEDDISTFYDVMLKESIFKFDATKFIKKSDVIEIILTEEDICNDEGTDYDENCEIFSITYRYNRDLELLEEIDNYDNEDE